MRAAWMVAGWVVAALAAGAPTARADPAEATAQARAGNVTYVTGGVGEEERAAMLAVRSSYNVHITVAEKTTGAYLFGTTVAFIDATGSRLAEVSARGPWLFAQIPAGAYFVEAMHEGAQAAKPLRVRAAGRHELYFYFPAANGTDVAAR